MPTLERIGLTVASRWTRFRTRRVLLLLAVLSVVLAMVACDISCSSRSSVAPPPNNIHFKLKSIEPSNDGASLVGTFLFENMSDKPIRVPGLFGMSPTGHVFRPHYVEYEVLKGEKWARLEVGYDGVPEYYAIDPAVKYQFVIDLGPYHREQPPIQCRVLLTHFAPNGPALTSYISDPFVMEKVVD